MVFTARPVMTIEHIEHQAWRLGYLLTGTEAGASAALIRMLRAHDDPRKLSEDRRRRLVVMGAHEWQAKSGSWQGDPFAAMLESLPREAWFLSVVEGWGEVEVARAMGVARSALSGYLETAVSRLRAALGSEYEAAADALRERVRQLDPAASVASAHLLARRWAVRRRAVAALKFVVLVGALALFVWIGRDLLRAAERERVNKGLSESISNPIPPSSPAPAAKVDP